MTRALEHQEIEMAAKDLAIDIRVRTYRAADETEVVWLRRNGHLHGDAEGDPAVALRSAAAGPASCHHVLVVEVDGRIVGATAIARQRELIAHLLWLCIAPDWQSERCVAEHLVERAAATAREHGSLKLVVHTPLAASQVAGFFCRLGFAFHRERTAGSSHVIEFYVDLYARPDPLRGNSGESSRQVRGPHHTENTYEQVSLSWPDRKSGLHRGGPAMASPGRMAGIG